MRAPETLCLLAALAALPACQPDSVTAARDQLRRGPARNVTFSLPVLVDTLTLGEFLSEGSDTATTPSGILAVRFAPDSLTVQVGDQLRFDDIAFDPYTFSYDQMLETQQVSTSIALPAPPAGAAPSAPAVFAAAPSQVTFATPDGSTVSGATIATGYIVRTLDNQTDCDATLTVTLVDGNGDPVGVFAPAAVGAGTTFVDSLSVAGASVSQFVSVDPSADFGGCVPSPGGSVATDFTFRPMVLQAVNLTNVNETFADDYAALASETRLQAVDSVYVADGTLSLTVQNRLPIVLDLDLTLQGVLEGGVPVQRNFTVPAAAGDGSLTEATLDIDLANAVILPGSVLAQLQGAAVAPNATVTAAAASDAVVVSGDGTLQVAQLVGVLDPAATPELNVAVENTQSVTASDVDFGDFEDAVRGSTINEAVFAFALTNSLATPITLDNYTVGLAVTDGAGNPRRDLGGDIIYETDGAGAPLTLTLASAGTTQLVVPPSGTAAIQLTEAAPLLDRLVHLLLDDSSVALVGSGTAVVGDGVTLSRILATDELVITLDLLVGLDITLPDSGVVFSTNLVIEGAGLDALDADEIALRLVAAEGISDVENGIPYGVEVSIALIEGDFGDAVDVFTLPDHVVLPTVALPPAVVNATTGRVTAHTIAEVTQTLTGTHVRPLLGESVTVTARIRILPPDNSGGRGAVASGDPLILNIRASITYQAGGAP